MLKLFSLVVLLLEINLTRSANILAVFPYPSISHQLVFQPLIERLVLLDHNVTVITPYPQYKKEEAPHNLKEIDVQDVSCEIYRKILNSDLYKEQRSRLNQLKLALKIALEVFEGQMLNEQVQDILKGVNKNFDIILIEAFLKVCLGLSHVFKGPIIQISSLGPVPYNQDSYGIPNHPFLYPSFWNRRIYNLTVFEKIKELQMNQWWIKNIREELEIEENRILRKVIGPGTPNISELKKNVDMLFLNIHPIFVGNQPVPPDVIYVGGMHIKPRKEVPKDLSKILDSSKNGVVYFSMGSNVKMSHLPSETVQIFINTFSNLPYDILWKCDEDLQITSTNIKVLKWFPQSDLLVHPKVKLFITQGGLQSTDEAINAGVPLIGLPMLADQWYNVEKYVHHKIGLNLDISTLTKEGLTNAIETVITNNSYRQNILRLRGRMQDQKEKPLERAVRWIEYTLQHGGAKHMRSGGANLTWQQYYELEIIIAAVAIILISLGMFSTFLYFIIQLILKFFKQKIKLP